MVSIKKIDTLDLQEDLQEEILALSGMYHYSPKRKPTGYSNSYNPSSVSNPV
jgi:hypothetical protein